MDVEGQRAAPAPDAEEVVDAVLADVDEPRAADLVVADGGDQHSVMVAMDAHDAQALVERLVHQAQVGALQKRWVYEIGRGRSITRGLTGDCVEDVVQQMNWTGKCAIGIREGSAVFEVVEADEGYGVEPFWCVTVEAVDGRVGSIFAGTSMEPQWMRLTDGVAERYRREGKTLRDGNKVFDRFSRAKALNKAQRNALEKHIPEVVKQTIIAMAAGRPDLVEHIQTEEERKVAEMPPPLATPEAEALRVELEGIYDRIRELGKGAGKVKFPPGRFASWMLQSHHSMDGLERMRAYLLEQLEVLPGVLEGERLDRLASESVLEVGCPSCGVVAKRRCVGGDGKPKRDCVERRAARREQLEEVS